MTKRVAIIGAGIGGLVAIKECLVAGLEPVCFEGSPHVGGLWHYDEKNDRNENSPMYKNVFINISRDMLPYSDFPCPKDWPIYMPKSYVGQYLEMYADHFDLRRHVRFNHRVQRLRQDPTTKRWTVRYVTVEGETPRGEETDETYDWVLVCTGHYQDPTIPRFEGAERFKGKAMHVMAYYDYKDFIGKKVVVVGPGASGSDVAVELSYHAEVYLSSRNGSWFVPRVKDNLPVDMAISRLLWSLPGRFQEWFATNFVGIRPPGHLRPSHGFSDKWVPIAPHALLERISFGKIRTKPNISRFAENGRDIEFVDGTVIRDVDVVIYATGYGYRFDFVDPAVMTNGTITAKDQFDGKILKENTWLWKGIIPPRHEGIAFIGLLEVLHSQWTISELQIRYLTSLIAGRTQHPLPTPVEMDLQIVAQRKTIPPTHLVNFEPAYLSYFDWLANEAAGAAPEPLKIIREYGFGFWLKILTGPLVPSQWRLVGRDRWDGAKSVVEDCYRRVQEGDLIHVEIGSERL